MVIETVLGQIARGGGADYFGVADLTPARDFIREQGGDLPASFPRAVAVGVALPHGLTAPLLSHDSDNGVLMTYDRYVYQVCNTLIDQITMRLAREIEKAGHRAMPVAASLRIKDKYLAGVVSQKLAAHLAGLGWVGKSCLLINPIDGPRVRWGTVLTDMPLETGTALERDCGKCTECVNACPVGAITGRHFNPAEPRSERLDVEKCEAYRNTLLLSTGARTCGKCLAACPFGRVKYK